MGSAKSKTCFLLLHEFVFFIWEGRIPSDNQGLPQLCAQEPLLEGWGGGIEDAGSLIQLGCM